MAGNTVANSVMVERREPTFVQFKAGVKVEGILRRVERVTVKGQPVTRYLVEDGVMQIDERNGAVTAFHSDGKFSKFLGTTQIDEHIRIQDAGHYVVIKCIGEDLMVRRGENCMKVFEFKISTGAVAFGPVHAGQAPDGSEEISDADIPF